MNLINITEVGYVRTILKHFLIQDYDQPSTDMVNVLTSMVENCYDKSQSLACETGNLTNNVYNELI